MKITYNIGKTLTSRPTYDITGLSRPAVVLIKELVELYHLGEKVITMGDGMQLKGKRYKYVIKEAKKLNKELEAIL